MLCGWVPACSGLFICWMSAHVIKLTLSFTVLDNLRGRPSGGANTRPSHCPCGYSSSPITQASSGQGTTQKGWETNSIFSEDHRVGSLRWRNEGLLLGFCFYNQRGKKISSKLSFKKWSQNSKEKEKGEEITTDFLQLKQPAWDWYFTLFLPLIEFQ